MQNRILIIGSGLGGLALAQGLHNAGFDVTVFERDESPTSRPQGYRLSIRSLGMKALEAVLSNEKFNRLSLAKVSDVGDGFTCANENMVPFYSVPHGHDAAVQLLRSELRTLLQEDIRIQWNKRLLRFEDTGDQVVAYFEDGTQATGDLLIGCDGAGSTVRELLPSVYGNSVRSIPKMVDGVRVIFGGQIDRTPEWDNLLPLNKTGFARFQGSHPHYMGVCFSERVDRSPTVFWVFSEEIKDRNDPLYKFDNGLECKMRILEHCKQLMKNEQWHPNLKKLVYDTPPEGIMMPWLTRTTKFSDSNQYPMVPTGRVTLLGDAAHVMPPDKGMGGNNVLEDARLLSALLKAAPTPIDWPSLIDRYEREMFERTKIAVDESERAAEYFRQLQTQSQESV